MLKSVSIKNFQSHRETDLTFDPGVNVITGTSDSGKTAILRSILWNINNRPSGDAFKNWDAPLKEAVSVAIELEDGSCVVLERQNGKNTYSIFDRDGKETSFTAIKTDVPSEVSALLNLVEYNIQTQHQSYFLLQDTPGEIARKLNDLVGLSVIDKLFSNIASQIRQLSARTVFLISERDKSLVELEKYKNLDEIGIIISSLEKLHAENAVAASSLNQIEEKLSTLEKIKTERENLIPLIALELRVLKIHESMTEISKASADIYNLNMFVTMINDLQEEIETEKAWSDLEPTYTDIIGKVNEKVNLLSDVNKLEWFIEADKSTVRFMNEEKATIKKLSEEYINLIKESNTCPTCGNRINAARLVAIERSFA